MASRRVGLTWIAVQSLGLAWAIQHHWALRPALMFAPPYVGFQVLAFLMVRAARSRGRARGKRPGARECRAGVDARAAWTRHARLGERLRIARELHDAMGHHLAGLSLNLEALAQREVPSPPLDTARSLTRRLLDDLESLVDTLGRERGIDLASALAALATRHPAPTRPRERRGTSRSRTRGTRTRSGAAARRSSPTRSSTRRPRTCGSPCACATRVELTARDDGNGCAHAAARARGSRACGGGCRSWAAPLTSRRGQGRLPGAGDPAPCGRVIRVLSRTTRRSCARASACCSSGCRTSRSSRRRRRRRGAGEAPRRQWTSGCWTCACQAAAGSTCCRRWTRGPGRPPCLLLTTFDDRDALLAGLRAGARATCARTSRSRRWYARSTRSRTAGRSSSPR